MSLMSAGSEAAHPFVSMSLAYSGGHMAAAGSRLTFGPSGVVAARGVKIEGSLLEAVGAAADPVLGVGGLGFVLAAGPHFAFGAFGRSAVRGDRLGGGLDWGRLGGSVWPWVLRLRAEVLLEMDTARLAAGVWAGLW